VVKVAAVVVVLAQPVATFRQLPEVTAGPVKRPRLQAVASPMPGAAGAAARQQAEQVALVVGLMARRVLRSLLEPQTRVVDRVVAVTPATWRTAAAES